MRRAAALLAAAVAVAGCGGGQSGATTPAAAPLRLDLQGVPKQTAETSVRVRGSVSADAEVTVDGEPVEAPGGRFSHRVPLEVGKNEIVVAASATGQDEVSQRLKVTRTAETEGGSAGTTDTGATGPSGGEVTGPATEGSGYPPPGECGVSPATGDPVCANEDGTLELDTEALEGPPGE